ncbi:TPR repeat family protein [Rhodobacteraceae bacterium KLH11]|nr:TPR repeat family protein [Rhodobacteraceae bacterium KLH11]
MKMRSMRRGIKEMDLILTAYADRNLSSMDDVGLETYDALLHENDQDLYQWVTGQAQPPARLENLIADIAQTFQNREKPSLTDFSEIRVMFSETAR